MPKKSGVLLFLRMFTPGLGLNSSVSTLRGDSPSARRSKGGMTSRLVPTGASTTIPPTGRRFY